jgi:two-component system sensor histidine kinase TctE
LAWLLLPLTVFVVISGATSWRTAENIASLVQDNALLSSARIIGEDLHWAPSDGTLPAGGNRIVVRVLPAALELFESPYQDSVFYKVEDGEHRLLAGNPGVPLPLNEGLSTAPTFYSTTLHDGRRVRAVAYVRALYDSGHTEAVTVAIAKTERSRDAMVARLWHPQLMRLILMLVLAMLLVYLGLTFELRPLMKLKDDVADRRPSQLQPIRAERLHIELRPIVEAINLCIARMSRQSVTQRQFISDAAHQLRTPLTLLDAQIQFARQRDSQDALLNDALASMQKSSRKLTTVTNKLLLLAQAESVPPAATRERVDLGAVISGVLEELIAFAQTRDIDLGAELNGDIAISGDAVLTNALVMNLVDNALRYTQKGGRVTVIADQDGDWARLQVVDNGPGISAEARARAFERFYRASTDTDGTGLGLAIVREIATRQRGSVRLAPGENGIGLVVSVDLRIWERERDNMSLVSPPPPPSALFSPKP